MPVVRIDLRQPTASGTYVGIGGVVTCTPTRRRLLDDVTHHPIVVVGDISVQLVDGVASPNLATTDGTWCWRITEPGGTVRHISVGATDADYGDCPDVDPNTLTPTADPEAAWWAALEAAITGGIALPAGGTTGQALVKTSSADGAVAWGDVAVSAASTTAQGIVELATTTEATTGTDTSRAVTPAGVKAAMASLTNAAAGLAVVTLWSGTGWRLPGGSADLTARPCPTTCPTINAGAPSATADASWMIAGTDLRLDAS